MPPAPDRRWSGAFLICPGCGQRNFFGRAACTACGASLRSHAATEPPAPGPFTGRRDADRIRGRSLTVAGSVMAVVAAAGGILVWRSLRAPEFAPVSGTVAEAAVPPALASTPAPAATEVPTVARPEDLATYERGRRLLAAGQVKRALEPLTEAARALPHDAAVAHDYGIALMRTGDADRGLFQLERASRLAPGVGSYRIDLIRELMAAGRRGPAARELQEILTRDPANQGAAEMLASLGVATGSAGGASPAMDLGGAGGGGSPRPAPAGGAFTNDDLERRRAPMAPPSHAPASPGPTG
jgi:hypothetical protein